jgi:hypothetical protein
MKKLFLLLFLVLAASLMTAPSSPAEERGIQASDSLDPEITKFLQQRYPGFRLAEKSDYCDFIRDNPENSSYKGTKWSFGAMKSDFNGDRLDDYVMVLYVKGRYPWLAVLKTKDPRRPYTIKEFGRIKRIKNGCLGFLILVGPPGGLAQGFFRIPLNPYPYIHQIGDGEYREIYWKNGVWNDQRYID